MKGDIKYKVREQPAQTHWDDEDESMRIMPRESSPQNTSLLSQGSITEDSILTTGQKRSEPETVIHPENNKRLKDDEPTYMRDLGHMAHVEIEILHGIIESDINSKRITFAQHKELHGSYLRISSIVRDMTLEHARAIGENTILKDYMMECIKSGNTRLIPATHRETAQNDQGGSGKSIKDWLGTRTEVTYAEKASGNIGGKSNLPLRKLTRKAAREKARKAPDPKGERYVLKVSPDEAKNVRKSIWTDLTKDNPNPRVQIIKTKDINNLVFVPEDEESKEGRQRYSRHKNQQRNQTYADNVRHRVRYGQGPH